MKIDQLKILVVDDEASLQELVKMVFERLGCTVCTAGSGEEAVRLFQNALLPDTKPYNLVLTDYNMGSGMKGLEFINKARTLAEHSPWSWSDTTLDFWLWSGTLNQEVINEAKSLGTSRIIAKPVTVDELQSFLIETYKSEAVNKP